MEGVLLGDLGVGRLDAVPAIDDPHVVQLQLVLACEPQLVIGKLGTPRQTQVAPLLHESARGDVVFNSGSVDLLLGPGLALHDLPAVRHVSHIDLSHDARVHV